MQPAHLVTLIYVNNLGECEAEDDSEGGVVALGRADRPVVGGEQFAVEGELGGSGGPQQERQQQQTEQHIAHPGGGQAGTGNGGDVPAGYPTCSGTASLFTS